MVMRREEELTEKVGKKRDAATAPSGVSSRARLMVGQF